MVWIWLGIAVSLLIIECCTTDLVSIWLALGSGITTIIVAIFPGIPVPWQIIMFVVFSAILLTLTRKFVKRYLARTKDQSITIRSLAKCRMSEWYIFLIHNRIKSTYKHKASFVIKFSCFIRC